MVKSAPHGHLSEEKALDIIKQIAVSIDYLHSKRMTHLDVKPDNVVMQDGNTPILIDFGLVKRYDKTGKPTTTNKAAGVSEGYAPLEQYAGITEFTPEADIYALAATLLFMLSGKTPYKAGQMKAEIIESWLTGVASARVIRAIIHAMAVLKDNRTKSVGQLFHELEAGGSNGGQGTKRFPPHPLPRPNRNYAWLIGIGVILVFAIIMYLGASKTSTETAEDVSITNSDTIWNTILSPSGETMFSWWGIVDLNGKPQGEGVIKYRDGDKDGRLRYEGMMKDGLRESETAKLFYTNGNSYEGSFVNDQFKEGKLILKSDGMYYVGTFKSDEPYNGKWYSISNGKEYSQVHNGVEK
jgi:serine/threonine protein kinase